MLQKCANPSCSAPFRSLREGKLFLAETLPHKPAAPSTELQPRVRRREHFSLCEPCSVRFTLRLDTEQGMLTVPISQYIAPHYLTRAAEQNR